MATLGNRECPWYLLGRRMLPYDLSAWQKVYDHFRKWRLGNLWEKINHLVREQVRHPTGCAATPSATILDAQLLKSIVLNSKTIFQKVSMGFSSRASSND